RRGLIADRGWRCSPDAPDSRPNCARQSDLFRCAKRGGTRPGWRFKPARRPNYHLLGLSPEEREVARHAFGKSYRNCESRSFRHVFPPGRNNDLPRVNSRSPRGVPLVSPPPPPPPARRRRLKAPIGMPVTALMAAGIVALSAPSAPATAVEYLDPTFGTSG